MQLTSGVEDWKNVSRHRMVTLNNSSDAACRIVDHAHNTYMKFPRILYTKNYRNRLSFTELFKI